MGKVSFVPVVSDWSPLFYSRYFDISPNRYNKKVYNFKKYFGWEEVTDVELEAGRMHFAATLIDAGAFKPC